MPFRYLTDPLFRLCFVLYFVNRLVIKPWFPNTFSHSYFNDLICLPFWVPIMLTIMRKTGIRRIDIPPTGMELIIPLLLWSWTFELFLPQLSFFAHRTTSDYHDILFYTAGAALAAIAWRIYYRVPCPSTVTQPSNGLTENRKDEDRHSDSAGAA